MDHLTEGERAARVRLQRLVQTRDTSLAALSRLIGRNAAYLQQYVTRGSPRHLEPEDVRTLTEFLGIDERTITTRRMFGGPDERELDAGGSSRDWVDVPRLPLDASAGPGAVGAQEIPYDSIRFSRRFLREIGLEGADLTAIRVEGDSMEPLLRSGDEIFVDRNKRGGDGVFVVRIDDALHVKQVQVSGPGRIALVSANSAYAPIEIAIDEVEIVGRVVWKGSRL